jgi:hypothetical protein
VIAQKKGETSWAGVNPLTTPPITDAKGDRWWFLKAGDKGRTRGDAIRRGARLQLIGVSRNLAVLAV